MTKNNSIILNSVFYVQADAYQVYILHQHWGPILLDMYTSLYGQAQCLVLYTVLLENTVTVLCRDPHIHS